MIYAMYAVFGVAFSGVVLGVYMIYIDWLTAFDRRLKEKQMRQAWLERVRASTKDALDVPYIES